MNAMRIEPIDPMELDPDTADAMADLLAASLGAAGLDLPRPVGASLLGELQLGWEGRPVGGVWLARDEDRLVGLLVAEFPEWENTGTVDLDATVLPAYRRRGVGTALHHAAITAAVAAGRPTSYSGAFEGTDGVPVLEALGYQRLSSEAVRRVSLHDAPAGLWDRLYDEAAGVAVDYEIVHQVGPPP
jgi:GNAT superfamily N-acetyltransferase